MSTECPLFIHYLSYLILRRDIVVGTVVVVEVVVVEVVVDAVVVGAVVLDAVVDAVNF